MKRPAKRKPWVVLCKGERAGAWARPYGYATEGWAKRHAKELDWDGAACGPHRIVKLRD